MGVGQGRDAWVKPTRYCSSLINDNSSHDVACQLTYKHIFIRKHFDHKFERSSSYGNIAPRRAYYPTKLSFSSPAALDEIISGTLYKVS